MRDARWLNYFRIGYRLADRFRQGRVFLAGDAAHINSLVGGHGMNTGIQDACNLAWKLALASKGLVSDALLDSYEAERRPVAEKMIAGTRDLTEPNDSYRFMTKAQKETLIKGFQMNPDDLMSFYRNFEELDLDYSASPLSRDDSSGLSRQVKPGSEARNVEGLTYEGQTCDLFSLLGGPNHALFLFAGELGDGDTTALLSKWTKRLPWIEKYLVSIGKGRRNLPKDFRLLYDPQAQFTQRYGMLDGGLYLIRPDGYISYRTSKAKGVGNYLAEVMQACISRPQ
ncbi:hypothetical protein GCM10007094_00340 [Pseudovibrio japonicus]|uniref:FAD-binding domain-containing protein n=1 Tax=Pseudovibrio japonicus TaxID=366534 RepID=A0ABQ3E1P2_9HYPH|nr:hypothetical protein GCM10007094_00340 [Pseudovibrio japonicus]